MKVYKIISTIERWIWQLKTKLPYLYPMKVKFADNGNIMEAESVKELVTCMRFNSFTKDKTNKEYMLNYASRAVLFSDEDIRATNEEEFFNDLIRLKHIEVL